MEVPVQETPVAATTTQEARSTSIVRSRTPWLTQDKSNHFRSRWNEIQGKFVDEPLIAVQEADTLVAW